MDYDLADFAMQMPPAEKQAMMAQLLRRRQQSESLAQAQAQANQSSPLVCAARSAWKSTW